MTQEYIPDKKIHGRDGDRQNLETAPYLEEGSLPQGRCVGTVVEGSATRGIQVRLDASASVEDVKVGTFVTIQGQSLRFFGVVTDIGLGATDADIKHNPPGIEDSFIAQVMAGVTAYGTLSVLPVLAMPAVLGDSVGPSPAKTVPSHFSKVHIASEQDVEAVFGSEAEGNFWIGSPLDMETKVCLNLKELVMRSNGVFGKSGTGKTFLTCLLLIGIIQGDLASSLIFDMHSEYGWQGYREGGGSVKGLKQLFPSKVAVFALDEESSLRRGLSPDEVVNIGYDEIEPEDIEILRETLNLSEVAADGAYLLERKWGKEWVSWFLELPGREELHSLAAELNVNERALATLQNRLQQLRRFHFLVPHAASDSVKRILEHLDRGMHVVLEFGRYEDNLTAYILVTNILTRRIHQLYVRRKEQAMAEGGVEPRPLVITIEEAHKFLNPAVSEQTIFGAIAREMRKYNVTLLIIDQRPSAIDTEVMSQIGTKLTCLLDNERDIEAVLAGVPGSREMRAVLSRLESRQQALILGHAVPMPVVVHTREYGSAESYAELGRTRRKGKPAAVSQKRSLDEELRDLF